MSAGLSCNGSLAAAAATLSCTCLADAVDGAAAVAASAAVAVGVAVSCSLPRRTSYNNLLKAKLSVLSHAAADQQQQQQNQARSSCSSACVWVLSSSPHTRTVSLSRSHILVKLAKPRKNQLNCLCTKWEKYFISLPPFAVYRSSPLRLRFVSASASASLWFSLFFFFLAFLFHRVFVLVFGFSILVLNILKLLLERLGGHRGKGKAGKGRRGSGLHLCLVAWLSSSSSSLLSTFVVGLSLISFCLSKIQVDIQIR